VELGVWVKNGKNWPRDVPATPVFFHSLIFWLLPLVQGPASHVRLKQKFIFKAGLRMKNGQNGTCPGRKGVNIIVAPCRAPWGWSKIDDFEGGSKMAILAILVKFPLFCTPKMAKIVFFKLKSP